MARPRWRPEPTTNTMLVLFRDRRGRVSHVVIGSALLDADWAADVSMLMPENETPSLVELFSDTPREARRVFKEFCDLGDVHPDPEDFKQVWLPPAAGLQAVSWLRHSLAESRSSIRRLLSPASIQELSRIHAVLGTAEASGLTFHFVEVRERESRRFAGREMIGGPENNEMHLASARRSTTVRARR
jgi:hypothetical protein